jgi:hypothetical protein
VVDVAAPRSCGHLIDAHDWLEGVDRAAVDNQDNVDELSTFGLLAGTVDRVRISRGEQQSSRTLPVGFRPAGAVPAVFRNVHAREGDRRQRVDVAFSFPSGRALVRILLSRRTCRPPGRFGQPSRKHLQLVAQSRPQRFALVLGPLTADNSVSGSEEQVFFGAGEQ